MNYWIADPDSPMGIRKLTDSEARENFGVSLGGAILGNAGAARFNLTTSHSQTSSMGDPAVDNGTPQPRPSALTRAAERWGVATVIPNPAPMPSHTPAEGPRSA